MSQRRRQAGGFPQTASFKPPPAGIGAVGEWSVGQTKSLEGILTHLSGIVARFDRDFRHLYVSPSIEEFAGLPPEAFLGKSNRELGMPSDLVECWEAALEHVFTTGRQLPIEFMFSGPKGRSCFEAILAPEIGPAGNVVSVLAVNRNVTAQNTALAALEESEARYRMLVQQSGDAILLTAPDGQILSANPTACRMFGMTEEELRRAGRSGVVDLTDPRLVAALEERVATGRFTIWSKPGEGTRVSVEIRRQ
ncbi:MAG: PAS domain S-box protein [Candidatus Methylomirabilota bacterium]